MTMLKLVVVAALAAVALAANTNGGRTTFPYCACYEENCGVMMTNYKQTDTSISFTLGSNPACRFFNSRCTQDVNKIEINSFDYCRWTKVTATMDGVSLPYTFDHQGVSKLVPGAQVLKLYRKIGLGITLNSLAYRPVNFVITVDSAPGARRCTSINQLINRTATPSWPLSIAFFSTNEDCCAMVPPTSYAPPPSPPPPSPPPPSPPPPSPPPPSPSPPPPSPPPPFPKPPSPPPPSPPPPFPKPPSPPPPSPSPPPPSPPPPSPPPPPVCLACMTVQVALPLNGAFSPYTDLSSTDCAKLGAYITSNGCGSAPTAGLSAFTCSAGPTRVGFQNNFYSEIRVCATGSTNANIWQFGASLEICSLSVAQFLVGRSDCGINVITASSCGRTDVFQAPPCSPEVVDFPHSCFPGNSAWNGGRGSSPTGITGTPFVVKASASGKMITATIERQSCDRSVSAPMKSSPPNSCCDMTIDKIEFVMNKACRGEVKSVSVNGVYGSVSYAENSYLQASYPLPQQHEYQIVKVTQLNVVGMVTIKMELRDGMCSDPKVFFPEGKMWYAYFNGNEYSNNCCGTNSVKLF